MTVVFSSIIQIAFNRWINTIEIKGKIHTTNSENVCFVIAPRKEKALFNLFVQAKNYLDN